MELVIGGAFQGKLTWALRHYGLTMADVCDLAAGDPVPGKKCYWHFLRLTCLSLELIGEQPAQQPHNHPDHETGHQHEDEQADQHNSRRYEKLYHIYTSLLKSFGPAVDI